MVKLRIHVVPGRVPFLLSKGVIKALGGKLDTTTGKLELSKIGETVQLHEGVSGHYQLRLCEEKRARAKPGATSELEVLVTKPTGEKGFPLADAAIHATQGFQ